jgi:hypothetical protein
MNFELLVKSILLESPDSLTFRGKELSFHAKTGSPQTFFITPVYIRKNYKQGYQSDAKSALGMCVVYCSSLPHESEDIRKEIYREDSNTEELTHWNISALLVYNKVYPYDKLKQFGIHVYSPKTDADAYFERVRKTYPNFAFTLPSVSEGMPVTHKGRFWIVEDKIVVSTWHFDKDICTQYIIPFLKDAFGAEEDDIVFEVASFEENDSPEKGNEKYVSGSALSQNKIQIIQQPYEKELSILLAKLHSTPQGEQRNKIKEELKELLDRHGLDPKNYGLSDEILKPSEITAQKMLGPNDTIASLKAKQQTSESFRLS